MPNNTTTMTNIEQQRAKFAYACAKMAADKEGVKSKFAKEYKSYVKKTPMLIKTNGLGATVAFIFSKREKDSKQKKNAYDLMYQQITDWFAKDPKQLIADKLLAHNGKAPELTEVIVTLDSPLYRAVTAELLALFTWLKRFAEGLIEGETED